MNQQPITVENVGDFIRNYREHGDPRSKAGAWSAVFQFCKQNGMDSKTSGLESPSGIELVINFIQQLIDKQTI